MAIKRIQLRGISRTPSDRMTDDGGCAESLNVQLDNTELSPMTQPDLVDIGMSEDSSYDKIFIHKTTYEEIYVVADSYEVGYYKDGEYAAIVDLSEEQVKDIKSVGNTLIILTDKGMKYALYKKGKYSYLGDTIPGPSVKFESYSVYNGLLNNYYKTIELKKDPNGEGDFFGSVKTFNEKLWNDAVDGKGATSELADVKAEIWNKVNEGVQNIKANNAFAFPFLARVAVRLYDGSYIHQSVPILLGAGHESFADINGYLRWYKGGNSYSSVTLAFHNAFKARMRLSYYNAGYWSDIVKSVDLFVSTDITYPVVNSNLGYLELLSDDTGNNGVTDYSNKTYKIRFDNGGMSDLQAMEKEILSKSNFFKVDSFLINDIYSKASDYDLGQAMRKVPQDDLVLMERLPDYEQSFSRIIPSRLYTMNNRLMAVGSQRTIALGYDQLQSQNIIYKKFPDTTYQKYAIAYYVDSNGEEHKVYNPSFIGEYEVDGNVSRPYGLMFHPDSRCTKAEIFHEGEVRTVTMKPHPSLNCSYGYWGLDKEILDLPISKDDVTQSEFLSGINEVEEDAQRLYVSLVNNPFYFPISGNTIAASDVIGVAVAKRALSQGQFGQFTIYLFTKEGIWALETGADGSIISSKPLSSDVCVNPDSITPIEREVVFVSEQGVMLLQGGQVTNISPFMNGRHYQIENSARTIIENQDFFCDLLPALSDSTHFLAFVKEASVAYDYAGRRLIFVKKDEKYQYIYKLDTQTWHKAAYDLELVAPINSYPECLVQGLEVAGEEKRIFWKVVDNQAQESYDFLIERISLVMPTLNPARARLFLNGRVSLNVTSLTEEEREWLYDDMDKYHVLTEFKELVTEVTATRIYDFSTILDAAESKEPVRGVIATRPFDLGEPDVFKTITDVRIRGQFAKGAVKFILLASNDGINFVTVSTLRGRSWKLFRMVILADLAPTERISWVDVQYETNFTNKLR